MGALDQSHCNNIIDASLGTAAFIATVLPIRCRLMTANGTSNSIGTELATSGGYTSGVGAPTVTFSAAASQQAANSAAVTVTNMPAATIVGAELWDSSSPRRKWWGALAASKTTASGDTFSMAISALAVLIP